MLTEQSLNEILGNVKLLLLAKNSDYGNAWEKHGIVGVLVRLSDKSLRLESLSGKDSLVVDEKIEDTLMDMIGYCVLGLLWQSKRNECSE